MSLLPSVSVVVPTRDRLRMVVDCMRAIDAQDYAGPIEILVVIDGPAHDLKIEGLSRPFRVLTNDRTPGLAGARNTGINAAEGEWVAFCDDDDIWKQNKLSRQMGVVERDDAVEFVTCAMEVLFGERRTLRHAGQDEVTRDDLLESRMAMLHSSSFLIRRSLLLSGIGLVDEKAPASQNEDWDLLLRASARRPIRHVDEALISVLWGETSGFANRWEGRVAGLHWILEKHPDITGSRRGSARVYGQLAYGHAVLGQRRTAARWALRALRQRPIEPRAYLAALVASGMASPEWVQSTLHRRGRGV